MPERVIEYKLTITEHKKFKFIAEPPTAEQAAAELKELIWDAMGSPDENVMQIEITNVTINQTD